MIYYELDEETGEIKPTDKILVEVKPGDILRRKAQLEYCRNNKNNNDEFVWLLFKYGESLFPNISAANLTRLMYVATFVDNNGFIMRKDELKLRTKLNRARWSEFWNEMVENNILYEKDKNIYMNSKYIVKGKITTNKNYIRLFCEYIRQLYDGCENTADHKQLSYIFKIIPYINRRTNIICKNPVEQEEKDVTPMSLGDFCDILGYDRSNARRLAIELLKIRIDGELALGFFVSDMRVETWMLVANPKLYFGGKYDALFQKYRNLFIEEAKNYKKVLENK